MPSTGHTRRRSAIAASLLSVIAAACAHRSGTSTPPPATSPSTVTSEDVARNPNVPIEQILSGRIAGVTVARGQDGGMVVRIRGAASYYGPEAPLYVVDGVVMEPGPSGSLGINPYDVESISVLKDAASLTMYGSRGANGVVVIKLKKGTTQRKP